MIYDIRSDLFRSFLVSYGSGKKEAMPKSMTLVAEYNQAKPTGPSGSV